MTPSTGMRLAGADGYQVAHPHLLHRDLCLRPRPAGPVAVLGARSIRRAMACAGLALGAGLQELAQGDEGEDHAGRLEVQVHVVLLHPGHVPVAQAVADLVNGKDAIDHSRDGAHGDERVHVGAAVEQGAEAVFVVLVVDIQDRQGEQELGKGEGYGVLVTHQEKAGRGAPIMCPMEI